MHVAVCVLQRCLTLLGNGRLATTQTRRAMHGMHCGSPAQTMAYREDPGVSEATLAYHLSAREALLYEYTHEVEGLKDNVYSQTEKNRKLAAENAEQLQRLVKQIAELSKEEDRAQKVCVEQVALALKEKFFYVQESEKEVEILQWQISECEQQILELTEEVNKWSHFKNVTYPERLAKMDAMRDELQRMKEVEREEESALQSQLEMAKEEIQRRGNTRQEKDRDVVAESLLSLLDAKMLGEYRDNMWLHRELLSQQEAYDRLLEETTAIERQNLEVLNQLLAAEREERGRGSEQLRGAATSLCGPSVLGQLVRVPGRGSGAVTPEDGSVTSRVEHHPRGSSPAAGRGSERRQEVMRQVDQVSLEPLGLQELRQLRVTGKSPFRPRTRPSTNEEISLPRIPSAEQSTSGGRARKQSWPISVRMLKSITTAP